MSMKVEGQKCPICRAYLFDDDDIVFCPVCGAPHHRDCYNSVGHCGYEELHGTDKQFDLRAVLESNNAREENETVNENEDDIIKNRCINCGRELDDDMRVCPYCGRPRMRVYAIDLLGGVTKNTDIGDGVTAAQAREIVAVNSQMYIPKFKKINDGAKVSWNWLAFLFPQSWFFLRKMYKVGALCLSIMVACMVLTVPVSNFAFQFAVSNYSELAQALLQNFDKIGTFNIVLVFVSVFLNIALRLFAGLFGNRIYRRSVIEKVKGMDSSELSKEDYLRKKGGINIIFFFVTLLGLNYLIQFIAAFI